MLIVPSSDIMLARGVFAPHDFVNLVPEGLISTEVEHPWLKLHFA